MCGIAGIVTLDGSREINRERLAGMGRDQAAVAGVVHGTTVATNALLEEEFSGLGFITTEGFRHVLEIARQSVPDGYGNSYFWVKPDRIVPLHHVYEVAERLDVRGRVLRPLDETAAATIVAALRRERLTSIGVSFVHAYANPAHERRMREILARALPDAHVSISSDVLPEYREYERTMTTLVDAFVKGRVARYVGAIQERLASEPRLRRGAGGSEATVPFYVMKSNGGVISAHEVAEQPITTILSGPAAGALGASALAVAAGYDRVLTADVGGTSTDVCLIEHGVPGTTTDGAVGRFPVKVPMIETGTASALPRDGDVMESGYVHGLARRLRQEHGIEVDWEVLHGDPADAIVSYLHDGENILLAMTTHGRSGLSQVVAGSVTHEVVHEAPCPVAVWRPQAA